MARKIMKGAPQLNWRNVPAEGMGEGMLTGHRLARDLMAFARDCSDESAASKIVEALQLSHLATCGGLGDRDSTTTWAAHALWDDIGEILVAASQHVDFESHFKVQSAEATALIQKLRSPAAAAADVAVRKAMGRP